MKPRQSSVPTRWLVADERTGESLWAVVRAMPRGSGVLILCHGLAKRERARVLSRLRCFARQRGLVLVDERRGGAARIHDVRELRRAAIAKVPLLFLSPMYPTRSHPDWKPMPPMRAAALVRLSKAPVIALGGMNERRFRRLQRLGFQGWAGIDAWLAANVPKVTR